MPAAELLPSIKLYPDNNKNVTRDSIGLGEIISRTDRLPVINCEQKHQLQPAV